MPLSSLRALVPMQPHWVMPQKALQKSNWIKSPAPRMGQRPPPTPSDSSSSSSHTERTWITHNSAQTTPSSKEQGFLPTPSCRIPTMLPLATCTLAFSHHNARKKHQSTVKNTIQENIQQEKEKTVICLQLWGRILDSSTVKYGQCLKF